MKTGIFSLGALALCQLAAAQPHMRPKHLHLHHARDQLAARDVVTVTHPAVKVEEVIVYVDANGKEISRVSKLVDAPAAAPVAAAAPVVAKPQTTPKAKVAAAPAAAAPAPVVAPAPVAKVAQVEKKPVPQPKPAPAPSSVAPAPSSSPKPSPPSSGPGFGYGVSYAPYKSTSTNRCKSSDEISKDLSVMEPFSLLRIYGTDCEQVENVLTATKDKNIKLFAGIFNVNNWQAEADIIISAVKASSQGWDAIHTISVGNEVVNGGGSVSAVTGAVNAARTYLKNAGYQGFVVTVDTMMALDGNPELWQNSDYVAMNCHAFFDGNVAAEGAGDFVAKWVKHFQDKASGKMVVVTESGWPSGGNQHGSAIPGSSQQAAATESLKAAVPNNLVLYSAFNNAWLEDNAYTYGAEHYWGILNNGVSPSG